MQAGSFNDSDIRQPLHRWLTIAHAECADTEILHEMKMPRPSARIDLAVINGELAGFEIKSDLDTLTRLRRQAPAFNAVFDRVYLVTTDRHAAAAKSAVPDWWSILLPAPETSGGVNQFEVAQRGGTNPAVDLEAVVHVLLRKEMLDILDGHNLTRGRRAQSREILISAILTELSQAEIKQAVREALKWRVRYSSSSWRYC